MPRSTLDIAIAVKEADENVTDEELRLCIAAMSGIEHFYRSALIDLIELIRDGKPEAMLEMKAEFAWGTVERMFEAQKKPPADWLGPGNIPGTPEQRERLAWAKNVYEKATGEKL
jgi:hypothetical protein